MAENIGNDFSTALNGAINNSTTSLTVLSGTGAPSASFRVRVDDELMLVTSVGGGTSWTVTRGIESTSAASHADGATVAHVITKAGLDQYLAERYNPLATTWTVVKKTADESVTSSAALQDDDTLQLAVSANTKYRIKVGAWVTGGAVGARWRVTGPASPTLVRIATIWDTDGSGSPAAFAGSHDSAFHASDQLGPGSGYLNGLLSFDILLHNGANSGTVKFTWGQISSNATPTYVRAGSTLEWMSF
jgi:hypothetical protein